ncbi:Cobalamin biosynthesis protein CbiG / Cobalt-precorrin-3b C17-methyltransferase [Candidatus Burkholderia verschuerenii]|uniref:Cobalamin biosynthesis protein CbiG / Cobalt-precorrin-3b C17-methyltransferase n=1 Tax=Candidatus Burkholderia verschuerenii TaxID=242163 RepID=A0A0L0MBB0_9BURK|nr:precorrin-3B C(17)-methyltransferase [Candidatus Burkholderia verschuerenii]KND59618.1 Cobalamin biosynthesis protein CbiG / Cobalt-precorrin-3b C17-methyltransferase [Candidatus Burkholderia verschuerenii]
MASVKTAIVILGPAALDTARRIQARIPESRVHGLAHRVSADIAYEDFGAHLRELYASNTAIVALCSAGIVIRALASSLDDKRAEPPVLAVTQDGSAVVPLLGGMSGVNVLAREIGAALDVAPAITTSGELRFGMCLLAPPAGYALADIERGKRFVSDLLAGETMRIEGVAPWLDHADLPRANDARRVVHVTPHSVADDEGLVIHPRCVVAWIEDAAHDDIAGQLRHALNEHGIAPLALAAIAAPMHAMENDALAQAAHVFDVPLRFCEHKLFDAAEDIALHIADSPVDVDTIGQPRGTLTVIGLGPGHADLMTPAARKALDAAQDILGYETYVHMAGPFRDDQRAHITDNREELQRARHAFELASAGRRVVVVSSGDPGVFAMAAAVLEALDDEHATRPAWRAVKLAIVPGVSASLATAARAGAPLGHDFCVLSLSDNLKPWNVTERRIAHACEADLVMAFYNPLSKARPTQFDRAIEIVRRYRAPETLIVLGRDIGRPAEQLRVVTLGELHGGLVDMRTMVIVGSSTTRRVGDWVYTPRWYE